METSVPGSFVVVFLALVIVDLSNCVDSGPSTVELNIEIAEELPVGTVVADLAAGAGLDVDRDALEFTMISGSFYQYFRIGGDAEQTSRSAGHLLIVDRTIDRDVICKHRCASYVFPHLKDFLCFGKARSTLATMLKQHCRSNVRLCRKDEISTQSSFDIVDVFGNKVERCCCGPA